MTTVQPTGHLAIVSQAARIALVVFGSTCGFTTNLVKVVFKTLLGLTFRRHPQDVQNMTKQNNLKF